MPIVTEHDQFYEAPDALGLPSLHLAHVDFLDDQMQIGGSINLGLPIKLVQSLFQPGALDLSKLALMAAGPLAGYAFAKVKNLFSNDLPPIQKIEDSPTVTAQAAPPIPSAPPVEYAPPQPNYYGRGMLNKKMVKLAKKKAKKSSIMGGKGLSIL